ncbi:MAG: sensor histidine kinase [Bryobacteraceae bacterium]|nr:sensor histidine kinase [Bryobacteraceae bacterium]
MICCLVSAGSLNAQRTDPIIRGIDLHMLERDEAAKSLPVKIRGVVTFAGLSYRSGFILDDGTRGIFVERSRDSVPPGGVSPAAESWRILEAGMLVEIEGVTGSGNFAPQVLAERLRVVGNAPLPRAAPVILPNLLTGSYDCQRVRLRGTLQDVGSRKWFENQSRFSLATPDGRCEIISLAPAIQGGTALVDAEVEVEGVCFTFFNPRAELAGVRLQISSLDQIKIMVPAPTDPFSVPRTSLSKLRPFGIEPPSLHRRQFEGTVTLSRPGEFFYVQQGERGVKVQTQQPQLLAMGDKVVISGFMEFQRHYAEVREAVFKVLGPGEPIIPLPVNRLQILGVFDGYTNRHALDADGRLVALKGRLIQLEKMDSGFRLYLQSDDALVEAEASGKIPASFAESLRLGSEVRLTGVCQVELSSSWPAQDNPRVTSFRLLLRSLNDIVITRQASWWTPERLWKVLAGISALTVCALAWALFLRRRVDEERRAREDEERAREAANVEFSATIRERERLAADLHDTLEQALTGVAFQLETMNRLRDQLTEPSFRHLSMARQILAGSREDVRRSVWNLRANVLEGRMLREALGFVACGLVERQEIEITTGGSGEEEALPDLIAGNLLMLAKEGITNALKHAKPHSIQLTVDYDPGCVTLIVEDDGCGFNPEEALGPHQGHFGLQGMRERANRLGGKLTIASEPGKGTRIVIRVDPKF